MYRKLNPEQKSNGQKSGKNDNKLLGNNNSVNLGNEAGGIFQLSFSNEENIKNLSFQNNQKGSNFLEKEIINENNINNNDIEEEIDQNPRQAYLNQVAAKLKKFESWAGNLKLDQPDSEMNESIQQEALDNSVLSADSVLEEDDDEEKKKDYSVIDENLPEVRSKRGDKPLLYEDPSELIENENQNVDDLIQDELDDLNAGQESIGGLNYVPWSSLVPRMRQNRNISEDEDQQENEDQQKGGNQQGSGNLQEGENRQEIGNQQEGGSWGTGLKRFFSNMFKWIGIQISRLFSKNTQRRYDNATSNALNNTEIGQTIRKHDLIPG